MLVRQRIVVLNKFFFCAHTPIPLPWRERERGGTRHVRNPHRFFFSRSCDSIGGCCDSRRGLCCTHFPCHEPELWTVIRPESAVRWAVPGARRCHRQSLGRAIVPELRSCHRCQDGLISSPCPWSCRPRSAPGGAVGAPSLPSTRAWKFIFQMPSKKQPGSLALGE
eukprot:scaffold1864_cov106-Isochrysis_galbana.AAC.14